MFEIDVDLSAIDDLERLTREVTDATNAGLLRVGQHAQQTMIAQVGKIHARPVPTKAQVAQHRKTGKSPAKRKIGAGGEAAWKREGKLQKAVEDATPKVVSASEVEMRIDEPHAASREGLGEDWQPKNPALGVVRKNTFARDTVKIIEPQVVPLFEDGFNRHLDGI